MPSLKPNLAGMLTLAGIISGTATIALKCTSGNNNLIAKHIIKENRAAIQKTFNLPQREIAKLNNRINAAYPLINKCILSQKIVDSLQTQNALKEYAKRACDTVKKVKI